MTLTFAHQPARTPLRSIYRGRSLGLLLVLVQTEARITAFTLGRGEATTGTGPLRNLLLLGSLLGGLFAIKQFELFQHRLLLATANRRCLCRGLLLIVAIWWRVQVVVREIGGLLQHRRTPAGNMKR